MQLRTPVFVSTIPKAGTHLLRGIFNRIFRAGQIYRDVDKPHVINEQDILSLQHLENKIYLGHLQFSPKLSELMSDYPKVLLVRDPRDYVLSQAHFYDKFRPGESILDKRFRELSSWEVKVSAAIFGLSQGGLRLGSVNEIYDSHCIKWLSSPNCLLVRFEDLLGSHVGGDDRRALKTVQKILKFIGIKPLDEDKLSDDIYIGSDPAKSNTFRSGKVGSWNQEFSAINVKQLKLVAPGLVSGLGYESDEEWDLCPAEPLGVIQRKVSIGYKKLEQKAYLDYNLQQLRSGDDANSSFDQRYSKLFNISSRSQELEDLVNSWASMIYFNRGEYKNALRIFNKLLLHKKKDPEGNYYKAYCLQSLGMNRKALKHYHISLQSGFSEFWVKYNRGILYKDLGDLKNARLDLQRVLEIQPGNEYVRKLLSETKGRKQLNQNWEENRALEESVSNIRGLIGRNLYEEASQLLSDLLKSFPENAELNYFYAFCLHQMRSDLHEALRHYNLALDSGFDEFWLRYNRGSLLTLLEDFHSALNDINKALILKADDAGAQYVLKMIYTRLGEIADLNNVKT